MRQVLAPLGVLLALGLLLRLIIAYVFLPGSGFGVDIGSFSAWAIELARNGPWSIYERPIFIDYTPGYLYVLWALGLVGTATGIDVGQLIKLPAIAADLGLAVAVFALAADLGASRRAALVAAATVLFVPVTWFNNAVWGQVDSVGTLVLVVAVRELWRGRSERAAILTTIAAIIKPQFGILIPLAAAVIIRRHLLERTEGASRLRRGPIRIATTTLAGLTTATLVCLPFGIAIAPLPFFGIAFEESLLGQIMLTAAGYPFVTVNAYNPWALVSLDGAGLASAGTWIRDLPNFEMPGEPYFAVLGAPAVVAGSLLLVATIAALMVFLWRRHDDRWALLAALAVMSIAFFVLPTRVHERYLYPFFALGAILMAVQPRWALVYGVLTAANLANVYGILTHPFYDNPGIGPLLEAGGGLGNRLGEAARSWGGVWLSAVGHTLGLVGATVLLARPAPRKADAGPGEPDLAGAALPGPSAAAEYESAAVWPDREPASPVAGPDTSLAPSSVPAGTDEGERPRGAAGLLGLPGWVARAADPQPPAPFDQTATFARERGGRLDRLDVWLLLVLVVAALSLRTFRLGEPLRMHFDEVYHARTAVEFLQHWRYGEPHGIFEWTHPHLAKYAMAGSLVLLGNDRAVSTSHLGVPVRDAAVEPRWDEVGGPAAGPPARGGERLYVATGSSLEVHDLRTRERLASFPLPGARAVAVDPAARLVYVGTEGGEIVAFDTAVAAASLRGADPSMIEALGPRAFANAREPVERLWVAARGGYLIAATGADGLLTFDAATAAEISRTTVAGRADLVEAGSGEGLVARPPEVADPAAAAALLATLIGGDAAALEALLRRDAFEVVLAGEVAESRPELEAAIADGRLPGHELRDLPLVAVTGEQGITFLEPATGRQTGFVALEASATGLVEVEGVGDPAIWAASGRELAIVSPPTTAAAARVADKVWMPGQVERVAFNLATQLVLALGRSGDGAQTTVYVVEPHSSAVFADVRLPFAPAAWALDVEPEHPAADRQQLLALAADGAAAAVDVGGYAFAWRAPGVVAGALMAGLLFLLARFLFRRRSIAVFAGLFSLADGMLFAQSRIAMNDAYVTLFIVAAVTLFAPIWTGDWRWRGAFWLVLPVVGLLLGLALASKWVGLFAVGGIGLLILLRSALGRWLIVIGLAAIAATLGYMAIATGPEATTGGNLTFLLLMVGLTLVAAAVNALHPLAWTVEEVRIAVAGPAAAGGIAAAVALGLAGLGMAPGPAPLALAIGMVAVGGLAAGAFKLCSRLGLGPLAPVPAPDDPAALLPSAEPAPAGWLRPGWLAGAPVAWAAVSLLAIPVAVYVISYLPWAALGNQIVAGFPAGHHGQTLLDLTASMYAYHDDLRATHAASSPWWAWPANLKPVWFYQESFAGGTAAAIYSSGNLAVWWLSIPALAFVGWQAFRRRSLGLAAVAIMFAALWLPWARIDRATFQYHYYAALPFVILALAYFTAELWSGPSRRTFLLARAAAAAALLGPVILWVFRLPLCFVVGVERALPGSPACTGAAAISLTPTIQLVGLLLILAAATGVVVWQLLDLDRVVRTPAAEPQVQPRLARVATIGGVGLAAFLGAWTFLPPTPILPMLSVPGEIVALGLSGIFVPLAWLVWNASSPRRFAVGAVLAAALVFVLFYPNVAGLPLPSTIFNWYQGLLPTWLYHFQFPVNTDPAVAVSLLAPGPIALFVAVLLAAAVVAYSAWLWRLDLAERRAAAGAVGGTAEG
jgi:dolichyl-phosphate-mannose--protein O-mannosyl transferase